MPVFFFVLFFCFVFFWHMQMLEVKDTHVCVRHLLHITDRCLGPDKLAVKRSGPYSVYGARSVG